MHTKGEKDRNNLLSEEQLIILQRYYNEDAQKFGCLMGKTKGKK
jgi:hypothetical protein